MPAFVVYCYKYDVGGKASGCDTYGLLRAVHSHNPTPYADIVRTTIQTDREAERKGARL